MILRYPSAHEFFDFAWASRTSARLFFALFAWVNVMDPAATITSILFSFDIPFSVSFALRIFWIDDGTTSS